MTGAADPVTGPRGTLFVVATPIGNLADITLRALDTLRDVPLIAAEDTRHTHRLLARHGIGTKTTSYHARSGPGRLRALLLHLEDGADLALVTDAGTPAVSDPGADLVAAWVAEGGVVVPIPGASAVLAAVVGSGIVGARWGFEGFLPRKGRERKDRLARIAGDERATILFEAPARVAATLRDLVAVCGPDRPGVVARELTKVHETFVRSSLAGLADAAANGTIPARGEFVLVVGDATSGPPDAEDNERAEAALAAALAEVDRLVADGTARGEAARQVAATTGLPRRRLYVTGARTRV